jgi:tRNA threonylcarbamoyladenosine biosynthesis protein TsaB
VNIFISFERITMAGKRGREYVSCWKREGLNHPMNPSPDRPMQLLLAVDTSGRNGSIALARCSFSEPRFAMVETVDLTGGIFSAQLIPQIAVLLEKHGFHKNELGGFAVVSGPGSFTGLRVGLAAIKALADVMQRPIATVSRLEAIARSGPVTGQVYSALEAGRGEVYVGHYEVGHSNRMLSERLRKREEFLVEARNRIVITPEADMAVAARQAGCNVEQIDYPRADAIAKLGWQRILRDETVRPEDLEANYIRRSDAEIFSKPRS